MSSKEDLEREVKDLEEQKEELKRNLADEADVDKKPAITTQIGQINMKLMQVLFQHIVQVSNHIFHLMKMNYC